MILHFPLLAWSLAVATVDSPSTFGVVICNVGLPIVGFVVLASNAVRPFCWISSDEASFLELAKMWYVVMVSPMLTEDFLRAVSEGGVGTLSCEERGESCLRDIFTVEEAVVGKAVEEGASMIRYIYKTLERMYIPPTRVFLND